MKRTNRVMIHIHLFKCAGTYLAAGIRLSYREEEWCVSKEAYWKMTEDEKEKIRFIYGHNLLPMCETMKRPFYTFCFFRQPLDRMWSAYWNIRECDAHQLSPIFKRFDLEELIDRINNDNISLNSNLRKLVKYYLKEHQTLSLLQCSNGSLELNPAMLIEAIGVASSLTFVGLAERPDDYWPLLSERFGFLDATNRLHESAQNRGKIKPPLSTASSSLLRKMEAWNEWDLQLYDWVVQHERDFI